MKRSQTLFTILSLFILLWTQTLEAYIEACYDYGDRSRYTEWCFGANALCWRPHGSDEYDSSLIPVHTSAIWEEEREGKHPIQGSYQYLEEYRTDKLFETDSLDYSLGFDLYLLKEIPDCYASFRLSWTHFSVDQTFSSIKGYEHHEVESNKATHFNNHFAANPLKRDLSIDYDRINLRSSKSYYVCDNASISGFLGLSYLRLDQQRRRAAECPDKDMSSTFLTYRETSELGAGLGEIGISGLIELCPATLYISSELGLVTGLGSRDTRLKGQTYQYVSPKGDNEYTTSIFTPGGDLSKKESDTLCFTGLEYKFEIGMHCQFCGFEYGLQAGYEGIFFHDLGSHYLPDSSAYLNSTKANIGFAGPYIGFAICL